MSDSNRKHTLDYFDKHKGELMISSDDNKIYQFIAIASDPDDYLYVLYDGRKVRFSTILSRLIVLKGKIDDDYNEFVRIAKLNWYSSDMIYGIDVHDKHYEEVVKQVKEHTKGIEEQVQTGDTEMLSEFVWDFN
jgi:hypothetical protein|tara:strand:- start:69 stop:470 length:402 start_codon:yes stop_codon:yes gene_type:complete